MPQIGRNEIVASAVNDVKQFESNDLDWITKLDRVVGNISRVLNQVQQIQMGSQSKIAVPQKTMVNATPRKEENMDNKLKMFLVVALTSLVQDGHGSKPIGQVITNLPITVNQVLEYVKKL